MKETLTVSIGTGLGLAQVDPTRTVTAFVLLWCRDEPERVGEIEMHRDRLIVIHCHHGGRSLRVARWLRENGFQHAQSMAGGIDEWSQEIDSSVPRY